MNKLLVFYLGIGILISCNRNTSTSESLDKGELKNTPFTTGLYPRHEINYTDSLIMVKSKIDFDTTVVRVNCKDTIISYLINLRTKKVIRLCSQRKHTNRINYMLTDQNRIDWDSTYGFPSEFIGPYLFSDMYRGGENGGDITKIKFKITNNQIQYIDSIQGGSYSEGAGTWEWLISNDGDPKAMLFGDDSWSYNNDTLLITPDGSAKTYLINLQKKDTLLFLQRPDKQIWNQWILENGILFSTETTPRLSFLKLYDLNGVLRWTAKSDYLEKLLVVADKNLIIGSGYYFLKEGNTRNYFTIAYDSETGEVKWNFSTRKAYNPTQNSSANPNLATSNLFIIGEDMYGLIVGEVSEYFGQNISHDNRLVIFNSKGQLYGTVNLSRESQNYSVITYGEKEFEVISNYENRRFKIHAP